MRKRYIYLILAIAFNMFSVSTAASFNAKLLDFHYRIYPDRFPVEASYQNTIDVPRNYTLGLQLAIKSAVSQNYTISLENIMLNNVNPYTFSFSARQLVQITVEGNTQGNMTNVPGGSYPAAWTPYFIRNAPFDLLEAVATATAQNTITAEANVTAGALIQLKIENNCPVGTYTGKVVISLNSTDKIELPISFKVHKAVISRENFLDCVHWISADPVDLSANGSQVSWWSEEHWKLLERAGKYLYEDGNNMMYTPLVNTANPLIQAKYVNGQLLFDYTQFDRWINLFKTIGYKYFDGFHLRYSGTQLTVFDVATNQNKTVETLGMNIGCFQELFLKNLNTHLIDLGIHDNFVMHLYDEPSAAAIDEYKHYNNLLVRCMPGIKSIDATNSSPQSYVDLVGLQVYSLTGLILNKDGTVKTRIESGRPVWLYNTSSPYPPYPNRHLDVPLTENRLWPLLTLKYKAAGYLFWAVNTYRGVQSEYTTSLGALPDGTQKHPPGDSWFYYRTTEGLIPSLRMMSFREGMIDASLLKQLAKTNPGQVETQLTKLIFPEIEQGQNLSFSTYFSNPCRADYIPKGYVTDFDAFSNNRKEVLDLLDQLLPN